LNGKVGGQEPMLMFLPLFKNKQESEINYRRNNMVGHSYRHTHSLA
jgi:hypothetical protein